MLHGNEEVELEDVWGFGKAIGVKFNGDKANMYNVLSQAGQKNVGKGGDGEGMRCTSLERKRVEGEGVGDG